MKKQTCQICQTDPLYNEQHDSWYCENCNLWIEKPCDDPHCWYCPKRPKKPMGFFRYWFNFLSK